MDPARHLDFQTELDCHQMDLGLWEILWRLLPGKATICPSQLTQVLVAAKPDSMLEEEVEPLSEWLEIFRRSDLVLVPILAGGHWTLLVCRRHIRSEPPALQAAASTMPGLSSTVTGCDKCNGAGCLRCDPVAAVAYSVRRENLAAQLSPDLWPVLPEGDWDLKYYDSLPNQSQACTAAAERLLVLLDKPGSLPARQEWFLQADNQTCGLRCLQAAEEELREFRGEGPCLFWPDTESCKRSVLVWLKAVMKKTASD